MDLPGAPMSMPVHVHGNSPAALIAIDELARNDVDIRWTHEAPPLWNDVVRMRDGLWVPMAPGEGVSTDLLRRLLVMGIPLDRKECGSVILHRGPSGIEGRFIRAGTTTGLAIQAALARRVSVWIRTGRVQVIPYHRIVGLRIGQAGMCVGIDTLNVIDATLHAFASRATLIADHGASVLSGTSGTHPQDVGHGMAACLRAGLPLTDLRSFDVHPWTVPERFRRRTVPWEIVRALLREEGETTIPRRIPPGIVRAPWAELAAEIARRHAAAGFPPIGPAHHRSRGGIWVDEGHGMTLLPALFAARPCAAETPDISSTDPHALLSALTSGLRSARGMVQWVREDGRASVTEDVPPSPGRIRVAQMLENTRRDNRDMESTAQSFLNESLSSITGRDEKGTDLLHALSSEALPDKTTWLNQALLRRLALIDAVELACELRSPRHARRALAEST